MNEPTHQWCPNCNAMLPIHLEVCPRCKTNVRTGTTARNLREIMQITAVIIGVSIIPFIIIIGIGLLCVNSMQ